MTSKEFKVRSAYWLERLKLMYQFQKVGMPVFSVTLCNVDGSKEYRVCVNDIQLDSFLQSALITRYSQADYDVELRYLNSFLVHISSSMRKKFGELVSSVTIKESNESLYPFFKSIVNRFLEYED